MGLFLNVEGFSSPSWHSIAVAVVGVVVAYLGAKK
jgi:type VI protein secretion system component VasF